MTTPVPVGPKFESADGTTFQACTLYLAASANIGIISRAPGGERTVYADTLYASPEMANSRAEQMRDAHNIYLIWKEKNCNG